MDEVMFYGTHNQYDGWGQAAKDYLRALTHTNKKIGAQSVVLSSNVDHSQEEWISKLESTKLTNPINIHHVLPGVLPPSDIWLGYTETANLQKTGWVDILNQYKACWVATTREEMNLSHSGVTVPIHVVPMPLNIQLINQVEKSDDYWHLKDNKFNFYFVGENNARKNLHHLILAYWREFSSKDKVRLILKINGNTNNFQSVLNQLRTIYRLHDNQSEEPELLVIDSYLKYNKLINLHKACDCFVMPSYGESTSRPLLTALYLEKQIICNSGIGACEQWMKIHKVRSTETPCMCISPPLPYLYSGRETWQQINVLDLQSTMRAVYNKSKWHDSNKEQVIKRHSYESVSRIINNVL